MAAAPAPTDLQPLIAGLAQGRFAELEQSALAFVERFPGHAVGWTALGLARTELGRHGEALADLQRSLERAPDDAQVRTYHAHVLKRLGRLAEAEAGYRQALSLQPEQAEALEHLERVLGSFETYCTVTQSIAQGIPVRVSVLDAQGAVLK